MKKIFIFFLIFSACSVYSKNWLVGPARTYTVPSQVAALAGNGDTVSIDSAVYTGDVCHWTANNLLLRGAGGMARLNANGNSYGGKAIWVIGGSNTRVQYIEFYNCHDAAGLDKNWAGIRQEAPNLTVSHCYFHDNDDGILAGTLNPSTIVIEFTEFNHNGYGDGYSHNLYINNVDTLIFRYNYSHHASIGHELKTRAHVNYILYNRFSDEATGDASRNIDMPNGGLAVVMGNVIEQGPNSGNSNLLEFGLEGLSNPSPHNLYLINNTIVNDKGSGNFISLQTGMDLFQGYNNIFAGPGSLLSGAANAIDTLKNWIAGSVSSCGFVNAAGYDYHLTAGSSGAINKGANAGTASNGYLLTPALEYVHPAGNTVRSNSGAIDIGAFEFIAPTAISEKNAGIKASFFVAEKTLHIIYGSNRSPYYRIIDLAGREIFKGRISEERTRVNLSAFQRGVYILEIGGEEGGSSALFFLQ